MNANVSIPLLDTWREKRSRERSAAGVGGPPARGRGAPTVRSPHSTDNVTFFNPRFTLFAPPSAAGGRPKTQLKFDFCPCTERTILRRGTADGTRTSTVRRGLRAREAFWGWHAKVGEKEEQVRSDGTNEGRKICPPSRVPWTSFPEQRQWCKVSLHLSKFYFTILLANPDSPSSSLIRGMII